MADNRNSLDTAKGVVTILQGTIAIITTIVTVSFFIFAINAKANKALDNEGKVEIRMDKVEKDNKDQDLKSESNQKEIMNKLTEIQLSLKDKQDRKQN